MFMQKVFLFFLLLFVSTCLWAQQSIRGVVLDDTGEPVVGASIVVKGTSTGCATDVDGTFELNVPDNAVLQVSFLGYQTVEVRATGQQPITINLKPDEALLDEVIVVGYGQQRRESLTGAMANIKSDKLKDVTTTSVENMLNSKIAGVFVTPGSGKPGSEGQVVIRGQATLSGDTSPLWVVDGVIVGASPGQLNANDIESMTVLKDAASTAIYGSEGANGVIVVTTKIPPAQKMRLDLSVKMGVASLNRGNLKMMDGAEFYDYYRNFQNVDEVSFPRWNEELRNSNFDWYKLASRTGFNQDYNFTVSGGNDKMRNYFSLGYYGEDGAVKGLGLDRYSFRYKGSLKPLGWLTIKPEISGSLTDTDDRQYSVGAMYSMLPWDSPYDEEGNLVPNYYSGWVNNRGTNYMYDLQWNHSEYKNYEFSGSFNFDIRLTAWLTFSSVNNYRFLASKTHSYGDPRSSGAEGVSGRISESRDDVTRRYTNQLLRFHKEFGHHDVSAILAYEFKDYKYTFSQANGTGFVQSFNELNITSKPEKVDGYTQEWAVQSFFFKGNYVYDNRYMAELSLRRDGASNFGDDSKYGNFFSLSAGWNINRESWFKVDWVDNLKLRAAYGSVGNRPSSLYPQYDLYSVGYSYYNKAGALISQVGNRKLTWEKTYTAGAGIDAGFWKNRLYFTLDVYSKRTDNILYRVPVTGLTGVTSVWRNVGKMKNTGVELTVGGDIIRSNQLVWNLTFNIGHNKNKLTDLYKQLDDNGNYVTKPVIMSSSIAGAAQQILEIGEPVDTYYMPEWAGVNPDNGAPTWYKDAADGGRETTSNYSEAKYYKVGKASPDVFGGFNTTLTWRNFDLSAAFGYSYGGKIYSYFRQEFDSDGAYAGDRNQMKLKSGWSRWQKPGDHATHPVAKYYNQDKGNLMSSRYLEKSDFLKLRSLTLGYNFKLQQYGVQTVRVFFNGENLLTFTGYSGVDPELHHSDSGTAMGMTGVDVYPSVRKFMFGLNLTF
jgi:TonB-linked SusC/RagA family outer membrane protein